MFIIDFGICYASFYVLNNFSLYLWAQIFIGIIAFIFTLDIVKIIICLLLALFVITMVFFSDDIEDKRTLHKVRVMSEDDEENDDDETL